MRAKHLLICLTIAFAISGSIVASTAAAATETRIPGARINLDDGFVFDANTAGEYVIAWAPDDGSKFTRVLRGSMTTGSQRTWLLDTSFSSTPDVAIASNGTMAVAWTVHKYGRSSSHRMKYGAVWNEADAKINPHLLAKSTTEFVQNLGAVDVAINSSGTAAFTWQTAFPTERVNVALGNADGAFTRPRRIFKNDKPGFLGDPDVAIDDTGRTTIRWTDLGMNCKEDWFVPKNCKNRAPSLRHTQGSTALDFTPVSAVGKGCDWGSSDSNGLGQIFSLVYCQSGFYYTTSDPGQPFSALQKLPTLGGNRDLYSPDVKLLKDGTVFVVYESLRYRGKVGPYSQIAGSRSAFGAPLAAPIALTPEVDYSDSEDQGGYYSDGPVVLEGAGSQAYIAYNNLYTSKIGAIGSSGRVGAEIALPDGGETQLAVAPGGVGLAVFTRAKELREKFWHQLWTSSFTLPTPGP